MVIIKTITEEEFGRKSTPEKWPDYRIRVGARAVLYDNLGHIALIHVSNHKYYKLPGGGVDESETILDGLRRELLEEVGVTNIEIISEIGEVHEYRDEWDMKAEHHGYEAKIIGELGKSQRTDDEIIAGYEVIWVKDIDEAIKLVESGKKFINEYGQFFEVARELAFLNKVYSAPSE